MKVEVEHIIDDDAGGEPDAFVIIGFAHKVGQCKVSVCCVSFRLIYGIGEPHLEGISARLAPCFDNVLETFSRISLQMRGQQRGDHDGTRIDQWVVWLELIVEGKSVESLPGGLPAYVVVHSFISNLHGGNEVPSLLRFCFFLAYVPPRLPYSFTSQALA